MDEVDWEAEASVWGDETREWAEGAFVAGSSSWDSVSDFYEDDEPIEDILAAFQGAKCRGLTIAPKRVAEE